jgi:ATP-dependent Clp protease adaptor protein ClpS
MTQEIHKHKIKKEVKSQSDTERFLTLFNDEEHSFDYVIDALIEVCNHTLEQATQCTFITHYKGTCEVKKGSFNELLPMRKALTNKKLKVTIN